MTTENTTIADEKGPVTTQRKENFAKENGKRPIGTKGGKYTKSVPRVRKRVSSAKCATTNDGSNARVQVQEDIGQSKNLNLK